MFKKLLNKKLLKNQKGLTLIELLAVIVILAIVAAIAIPAIGNIINNSRDKATVSEALNYISGAKLAKIDDVCGEDNSPCTQNTTDIGKYIEGIDGTFSIELEGNDWVITWSKFDKIKDTKKYNFNTTDKIKETALKNSLDKKDTTEEKKD
ncbi:prepilin-type N-terminal cleavage/methylation domain-containing protein [Lysinibacillus sp. NPDC097279]|uniref:prepilin-type N-terminal cleavage/methylation domain-containing protein n=1 Tax=Lysinibacillus sp. NPDC097279 TaxID=3364143 RepID=UPI003811FCD3